MITVEFNKPFTFEGDTFNEINIVDDDFSSEDLDRVIARYRREYGTKAYDNYSADNRFWYIFAEKLTDKTQDFFKKLPAREFGRIKGELALFIVSTD